MSRSIDQTDEDTLPARIDALPAAMRRSLGEALGVRVQVSRDHRCGALLMVGERPVARLRRTASGWRPVLRVWGLPRSLPALAAYFLLRELRGADAALAAITAEYAARRDRLGAINKILARAESSTSLA